MTQVQSKIIQAIVGNNLGKRKYMQGESEIKRQLRREVAFGCPICRSPFLYYHHFDPPWRVKPHWNPKGIIAICGKHHDMAEGGHYSNEYLTKLKQASYSVADVKDIFPWQRGEFLIRLGGLYCGGIKAALKVDGDEIVTLSREEEDLLFLSFHLRSKNRQTIAKMDHNVFELGPSMPHDLETTTTANRLKIWYAERDIGLDVSLTHITPDELEKLLNKDRIRAFRKFEREQESKQFKEMLIGLPENIANEIRDLLKPKTQEEIDAKVKEFHQRFGDTGIPDHILQGQFSGDPVGSGIKHWVHSHCINKDGLIPLLNFENLSVYGIERHIRIRNGIGGMDYNFVVNVESAFSL